MSRKKNLLLNNVKADKIPFYNKFDLHKKDIMYLWYIRRANVKGN